MTRARGDAPPPAPLRLRPPGAARSGGRGTPNHRTRSRGHEPLRMSVANGVAPGGRRRARGYPHVVNAPVRRRRRSIARRAPRPPAHDRGEQHAQHPCREELHPVPRRHTAADHRGSTSLPGAGAGLGLARRRPEDPAHLPVQELPRGARLRRSRRASSPRPRAIIPTSPLAGATPPSRCRPRRSKVCTRTTSSWRRSSTVCRRTNAGLDSARARTVRIMPSSPGGRSAPEELAGARAGPDRPSPGE